MDAHYREADGAVAGMAETYGYAAGNYREDRRRWNVDDYVLFQYRGGLCRGHVVAVEFGAKSDLYRIRRHVPGAGSEVVEVVDLALMVF